MHTRSDLSRLDPNLPDNQRDDWAMGLAELAIAAGQPLPEGDQNTVVFPSYAAFVDGAAVPVAPVALAA